MGRDTVLTRKIAAKIMKEEYLTDQDFLARFRAEARSMGAVSDPGIAAVYDYGEENGSPYLVMEYVPGEALSTLLDRGGAMSEKETLQIVGRAAAALDAAHRSHVVHRDVKPGNILVTPDNHVKITDFGIARVADQAPLTKTGQVMGTAQYLAPEQATGKGSTPASDLYSLGIIMYEALAGVRPFTGESQVEIAIAQVNRKHPPLPGTVSEPVRRLVDSMLEKKPENRPASGAAVAAACTALGNGDVRAAYAAVPQMAPGGADSSAATRVIDRPDPATEATTRVMPRSVSSSGPAAGAAGAVAAGAAGAQAVQGAAGQGTRNGYGQGASGGTPTGSRNEVEERERTPKAAIVAIVVLVVAILAGLAWILYMFLGPQGGGEPDPVDTASVEPTEEETTEATTVTLDPDTYIGLSEGSAISNLNNLGLNADVSAVESDEPAGIVVDVLEGDDGYTFTRGDTVEIEVSTGPEEPEPEPEPEPTSEEPEPEPEPTSEEPEPEPTVEEPEPEVPEETTGGGNGNEGGGNGGPGNGTQGNDGQP